METTSVIQRPLAPAAARALVSADPTCSYPLAAAHDSVVDQSGGWVRIAADAPRLPQVHQTMRSQTPALAEGNGVNGSTVEVAGTVAKKRLFVTRGGVPPRGRPV